jgi:4'-phosphopantetheinyl transferase EntD
MLPTPVGGARSVESISAVRQVQQPGFSERSGLPQGQPAYSVASSVAMRRREFVAGLGKAAALVLLVTSPFAEAIAETSPEVQVVTATATASSESSACSASEGRAYNLCMVRGLFNITGVSCTCTQRGTAGAPIWECEGTATCKK